MTIKICQCRCRGNTITLSEHCSSELKKEVKAVVGGTAGLAMAGPLFWPKMVLAGPLFWPIMFLFLFFAVSFFSADLDIIKT